MKKGRRLELRQNSGFNDSFGRVLSTSPSGRLCQTSSYMHRHSLWYPLPLAAGGQFYAITVSIIEEDFSTVLC